MHKKTVRAVSAGLAATLAIGSFAVFPVSATHKLPTDYSNADNWLGRHSVSDINNMMTGLHDSYPDYAELGSLGKSWQGREMTLLTITDESVPAEQKTGIGVFGNVHGGERESGESAAYTAAWFLENKDDPTVQEILKKHILYVVPLLNPDGYAESDVYYVRSTSRPTDHNGDGVNNNDQYQDISGDGWIGHMYAAGGENADNPQAAFIGDIGMESPDSDGNGIPGDDPIESGNDINRNFDFEWDINTDGSKGDAPASEVETQNIQNFMATHPMAALTSLHTGTQAILYPWCSKPVDETNAQEVAENQLMATASEKMRLAYEDTTHRNFYAKNSYYDYPTYSELIDYAYAKYGTHAYTIEVYTQGVGNHSEYDPTHAPDDASVCYWNDADYPADTRYEYFSYDEIQSKLGLDPAAIKVTDYADNTVKTLADMKPAGLYIAADSWNNARCHYVPEDQDVMVEGAKDAILQMIYAEGRVTDPHPIQIDVADKADLRSALKQAKQMDQSLFGEADIANLDAAVAQAQTALEDRLSSQELVDATSANLWNVMASMVPSDGNLALTASPSASFVSGWESLNAVNDGVWGKASDTTETEAGGEASKYGSWGNKSTSESITYSWKSAVTLSSTEIMFFTDHGGLLLPASYSFDYLDDHGKWQPVSHAKGCGLQEDTFNVTTFDPVTTISLRLIMHKVAENENGVGVFEWRAKGALAQRPVIKTSLLTEIMQAEKLAQSDYTPESWSGFAAALAGAKAVLHDEAAAQQQVTDALEALQTARAVLVSSGVTPSESSAASESDMSSSGGQASVSLPSGSSQPDGSVQTGDTLPIAAAVLAGVCAVGVIASRKHR